LVEVGIMHGRLSPAQYGSIQSFPADSWREEFARAAEAGLACIEWIYEVRNEDRNPLATAEGVAEMLALARATGVEIRSICADYYMESQLITPEGEVDAARVAHLKVLMGQAAKLGARYMVLPFVDPSTLGTPARIAAAVTMLRDLAPVAEAAGVELHLETDLPPAAFADLLGRIDSPWIKANYDIGNSASLGYRPAEELAAIGPWLGSVHVKDRVLGGFTVPLGSGGADFETCFAQFARIGFDRWFILQAAREEGPTEVELARSNRLKVERWVAEARAVADA
jgi:hexulose-6-phosphate isomerase